MRRRRNIMQVPPLAQRLALQPECHMPSNQLHTDTGALRPDRRLRARLAKGLRKLERIAVHDSSLVQSAVAVTVIGSECGRDACFILTRRPDHLKRHRGQFALPGGRIDGNETIVEAALRELHEEVGVVASTTDVLGMLDDYATRSGFNIAPVVVWCPDTDIRPNPDEVRTVFRVPLAELLEPDVPVLEDQDGSIHPVLSTPLRTVGDRIYAPTAAILYQFREVALLGRQTRVAHFDQPRFAWT